METRIALLLAGLAFVGVPSVGHAQHPLRPARIAVLMHGTAEVHARGINALREGLHDLGYAEGKTVTIESQFYPSDRPDLLADRAKQLVRAAPDVIVALSTPEIRVLMQATSTIPIVMLFPGDPVGTGLVASLSRPGGNVTGLTVQMGDALGAKRLELLKEVLPKMSRMAVLFNPDNPIVRKDALTLCAAARGLGITTHSLEVREATEIAAAFSSAAAGHDQGLVVITDPLTWAHRRLIVDLVVRNQLPAIFYYKEYVVLGGLMSYGVDSLDHWRRAAGYVDKILKGRKPGELPVEQPVKFELAVNAGSARALGIMIPESVLLRADDVIK